MSWRPSLAVVTRRRRSKRRESRDGEGQRRQLFLASSNTNQGIRRGNTDVRSWHLRLAGSTAALLCLLDLLILHDWPRVTGPGCSSYGRALLRLRCSKVEQAMADLTGAGEGRQAGSRRGRRWAGVGARWLGVCKAS